MLDLMSLIITPAFAAEVAQTATADVAAESGATLMRFMPLALIFLVFYVLLIRPQQKQAAIHDSMIKELKKGDKVVTKAGFVGTVTKVEGETYLMVEIAKDVVVKVIRDTVTGLVDDAHPANENKNKKG